MRNILFAYWEAMRVPLLPAIAIICILLGGCFGVPSVKVPSVVEKPPTEIATQPTKVEKDELKAARAENDDLKGKIARSDARVARAESDAREARLDGLKLLLTWVTALLALGAIVAVVAAVWMHATTFYWLAGGCFAGGVAAQSFGFVLDHILIFCCVVLGLGLIAALIALWKHRTVQKVLANTERAVVGAVQVAEYLKPDEETEEEAKERKAEQAAILVDAGPGALDIVKSTLAKLQI